jgi:transposase
MEVVYERCCGLDVHKQTVVACVVVAGAERLPQKAIRTFGTMTEDVLALADWLDECAVTHVAMESTGVYWQPIWNLLEDRFTLVLANARHIKAVPGRKTDVKDAEWIADLLRHGLIQGSFVPDRRQRQLRELTRYRTSLVQERAAEVNRLQKTLEAANIKLASVASDLQGRSAREMLDALVAGTSDTRALAELARGRMREKLPQLERALRGCFAEHQRFLVAQQLAHLDFLDEAIAQISAEVGERLSPFEREATQRLDGIPGVGPRVAEIIVAEVGADPSRFPTEAHLASWAGMCPGNNESAGKRLSGKTRKGNRSLRSALVEAAHAAGHARKSYLGVQYHRLLPRRGKKKAAVAVGHSILTIAYHLLTRKVAYADLGPDYFDTRDRTSLQRRLIHRLEGLGNKVTVEPLPV